jgi:DNA-binding IclR family transcriptional regulator
MTKNKSPQGIQSLQLGINIIDVFLEQGKPLKSSDVQELTGMTKSNLYKYLYTLTQSGILYRDPIQNAYSLGSRLIEYGNAALGNTDIIGRIIPHLKDISQQTSLTTLLAIWSHDGPVIAHIWNANYGINIGAQIGAKLPLLSSSGKIFAAFMNGAEARDWELRELSKLTEVKRKTFIAEREEIEKNKFTYAVEPLIEHISSFSVPLLDFEKNLIGALTIVGFTPHIPTNADDEIGQYVIRQAHKVSASFGYRP